MSDKDIRAYIGMVIEKYKDDILSLDMCCERTEAFDKMVEEIKEGIQD